jgi:methyl-accepting chemotaxis protein
MRTQLLAAVADINPAERLRTEFDHVRAVVNETCKGLDNKMTNSLEGLIDTIQQNNQRIRGMEEAVEQNNEGFNQVVEALEAQKESIDANTEAVESSTRRVDANTEAVESFIGNNLGSDILSDVSSVCKTVKELNASVNQLVLDEAEHHHEVMEACVPGKSHTQHSSLGLIVVQRLQHLNLVAAT